MSIVGLVASGCGGVEHLRTGLVEPLLADGHIVAVTLTPTAAAWLRQLGEVVRLEEVTGLPVREKSRLLGEPKPHPVAELYVGAPLTANSTAKLALGIADNQALTVLSEGLGTSAPMVVFPCVNAAHAAHPAWGDHLARLAGAGVDLVSPGSDWPSAAPWGSILEAVRRRVHQRRSAPSNDR